MILILCYYRVSIFYVTYFGYSLKIKLTQPQTQVGVLIIFKIFCRSHWLQRGQWFPSFVHPVPSHPGRRHSPARRDLPHPSPRSYPHRPRPSTGHAPGPVRPRKSLQTGRTASSPTSRSRMGLATRRSFETPGSLADGHGPVFGTRAWDPSRVYPYANVRKVSVRSSAPV